MQQATAAALVAFSEGESEIGNHLIQLRAPAMPLGCQGDDYREIRFLTRSEEGAELSRKQSQTSSPAELG
jgi:hypothetical protein